MIVGVTGHRFYDEPTASYLIVEVRELLSRWKADDGDLRLVSLLAEGADQLVAGIAVDLDVPVDVVLPFEAYRESLQPEWNRGPISQTPCLIPTRELCPWYFPAYRSDGRSSKAPSTKNWTACWAH